MDCFEKNAENSGNADVASVHREKRVLIVGINTYGFAGLIDSIGDSAKVML